MRDLERELRALAVDWPATPDIAGAIRPRLEAQPSARRRMRRWWLGVIAGVLALGAAIEPARTAVLDAFGLRGVRIERRDTPPPRPARPPAGRELMLGPAITAAEAARRGFRPPAVLGRPDGAFRHDQDAVSFVYGRHPRFEVLVTVYRGSEPFIEKSAGPGVRIDRLRVEGDPAFFISGAEHGFGVLSPDGGGFESHRLAGDTLLVERRDALVRVETRDGRERAIAIARSVPPSG